MRKPATSIKHAEKAGQGDYGQQESPLECLEDRLCQSTIGGVGGDEPTGMLLPAVQKVREAGAG